MGERYLVMSNVRYAKGDTHARRFDSREEAERYARALWREHGYAALEDTHEQAVTTWA